MAQDMEAPTLDDLRGRVDPVLATLQNDWVREFEEAKKLRYEQEQRWLEDLRLYKGIYDPEVKSRMHKKRSDAFIRLVRAKTKGWTSRLHKILFPAGEDNFDLSNSPVPELDPAKHQATVMQMFQQWVVGNKVQARNPQEAQAIFAHFMQTEQEAILHAVNQVAADAASKMKQLVKDQLTEGKFTKIARRVMEDGHKLGTGILKGPLHQVTTEERWEALADEGEQVFQIGERLVERPYFDAIRCWDLYPDPYAIEVQKCEYIYERHMMNRVELQALSRRQGFRADIIDAYIREHPGGTALALEPWESEQRELSPGQSQIGGWSNRFEVLERWGWVFGYQLALAGVTVPEDQLGKPILVQAFMLGGMVIKVKRFPLRQKLPYHLYYYDKDDTSIWGEGVPRVQRDPQRLYNASIRAGVDNAAMSAGPQVEVNRDLLEDEEDTSVVPWRTWIRTGKGAEAQFPAVRVYQVQSNVERFMQMAQAFREMGDEVTTSPSYTYGTPDRGLTKTVGGLSMLMGSANVTLEDSAKAWDEGITEPFIAGLYDYNMVYSRRGEVKGDFNVKATGAVSLMAKEVRSQAIREFRMSTNNPSDAPFTNRVWLLQEEAKSLDLDPDKAVPNAEEIQRNMMAMQAASGVMRMPMLVQQPEQPQQQPAPNAPQLGAQGSEPPQPGSDIAGQGVRPEEATGIA